MKHWILSPIALLALVFALTFPTAAPAAPPAASPAPSAAQAPHPEIRAAIASLRKAQTHLREAAHDFGGHREDALKATDEAIHQLQVCLQYDK
jgi:hypothetical protein